MEILPFKWVLGEKCVFCQCADQCVCRLCVKLPYERFWLIRGADIWIVGKELLGKDAFINIQWEFLNMVITSATSNWLSFPRSCSTTTQLLMQQWYNKWKRRNGKTKGSWEKGEWERKGISSSGQNKMINVTSCMCHKRIQSFKWWPCG